MSKPRIYVKGMHGLGDTFHQRPVIKLLCEKYEVWLETSWPSLYYDTPAHFVAEGTELRTQLKNMEKEKALYETPPLTFDKRITIRYRARTAAECGSIFKAMMRDSGFKETDADFRFAPPKEWMAEADALIGAWRPAKPLLLYRPLVSRAEWDNCDRRNPHLGSYVELLRFIQKEFFVVSIADLKPGVEWMTSELIEADLEFHKGELNVQQLCGLMARAACAFASPGFLVPMARAIGTPVICIFGGFEDSQSFSIGYGPYLGIDTIRPCRCFSRTHPCTKKIDLPKAKLKIRGFLDAITSKN